jgi:ABC-type polysaccharide/polyol phosphate transport system ATPase subunit
MTNESIIKVDQVWKRYGLPLRPYLQQNIDRLRGQLDTDPTAYGPWALQDVSFEVKPGESLGIVGKNGAGKSTLLKMLAGVSPPTRGDITIRGRMFPMIELSAGMHRDLTGRENIRLLGAVMGFNEQMIRDKMPEIEEFSELGDWLERPIWQYSSGMQARLGFSVAVNVDADILLIDEVLSVGDVNFQKKCLARMDDLVSGGVTVLFVSHNPYSVERLCDKAIYLQDGHIAAVGEPADILTAYFQESVVKDDARRKEAGRRVIDPALRSGTGDFRVTDLTLHNPASHDVISEFTTGDSIQIRVSVDVKTPVYDANMSIRIHDSAGTIISVLRLSSAQAQQSLQSNGYLEGTVENCNLLPGAYWVEFMAKEQGGLVIDHLPYATSFTINGNNEIFQQTGNRGFVYLKADWDIIETTNPTIQS